MSVHALRARLSALLKNIRSHPNESDVKDYNSIVAGFESELHDPEFGHFCGLQRHRGARAARLWRNKVGQTKTEGSAACVFVIEPLKSLLERLRAQSADGFILQSSRGTPLSLDALNGRVITPALEKAGIAWCGYYACRRGISSKITDVSKNALNSSGLLRNDAMTALQFYTEAQSDSIRGAQLLVEQEGAQLAVKMIEKE
jgi:hypothetical protein